MAIPASMLSTNADLQHHQTVIYYQRKAEENLKGNLATYPLFDRVPLPTRNGKVMQFFQNNLMTPNTTPVSEGTPGLPRANGNIFGTVEIQQYADYVTFSDLLVETSISEIVKDTAEELGFSAARAVDVLNYAQMDATSDAIAASQIDLLPSPLPEYFTASVGRQIASSLQSQNVKPKESGYFAGVMHPLVAFDLTNDNTAGGVLDILMRNDYDRLKKGIQGNKVLTLDGIAWIMSTYVPTTADYESGGEIAYSSYAVGKRAFLCTSLSFTKVPGEANFMPTIRTYNGEQLVDPAGLIKASAAYNFKYATYVLPDGVARHRRVKCEVSVT